MILRGIAMPSSLISTMTQLLAEAKKTKKTGESMQMRPRLGQHFFSIFSFSQTDSQWKIGLAQYILDQRLI